MNLNQLNRKVKEKIEYRRDDLRDIVLPPLIDIPEIIKKDPEKGELYWCNILLKLIKADNNKEADNDDALTFFEEKFRSLTEEERIDILKNIPEGSPPKMHFDTEVKKGVEKGVKKGVKEGVKLLKN